MSVISAVTHRPKIWTPVKNNTCYNSSRTWDLLQLNIILLCFYSLFFDDSSFTAGVCYCYSLQPVTGLFQFLWFVSVTENMHIITIMHVSSHLWSVQLCGCRSWNYSLQHWCWPQSVWLMTSWINSSTEWPLLSESTHTKTKKRSMQIFISRDFVYTTPFIVPRLKIDSMVCLHNN